MRIGHASISENKDNGRNGKAKAGDQTGKEVCIREFYVKPWQTLLRAKDDQKAELMAQACESICNNSCVGYDQSQRLSLHNALIDINYNYKKLSTPCECDCSSFMTVCAECAGIKIPYQNGNAPVTANMVKWFSSTGEFEIITGEINNPKYLKRGDILVGPPNTHTVMVLDNGQNNTIKVLQIGSKGDDVKWLQQKLIDLGYDLGKWGADGDYGKQTAKAVKQFQMDNHLRVDGKVGPKTFKALEAE